MNEGIAGKRIGLLTASASRLGGGVSEAVIVQAEMIRAAGGEAVIFALADQHTAEDAARFAPSSVVACPVTGPPQVGYAPQLVDRLLQADLDCLHLHGIWMYPSHAGAAWARTTGRPYLISPHGMLDPWITARGRWKKALARIGYERRSWQAATCFHALTGREAADIRREAGRSDSVIVPNAGPDCSPPVTGPREPRLLFISRIHPKKNLAPLVAAWSDLAAEGALPDGAILTIAGWGEQDHVAEFEATLTNAPDSVRFIGPCFGSAKAEELARARFLILPSLSEGLPMTILEAWAAGAPTLMTTECNLPEGFAAGAALDCGMTRETIRAGLVQALAMPADQWLQMAQAAQKLAGDGFSASAIAARWADIYASLSSAQSDRAA
ncbi:glycosyltransferase [Novosphingobium sp.]|uniref:glycosyltransferase n=1 Tax=Novosphingobium sp. TaxID=1874826 RepID=UPI002732FC71|nr:glycosyltransferase [Novosphingobium sp.]MDP3906638.1 glycosyltransferase [Novosphingobium sp.]